VVVGAPDVDEMVEPAGELVVVIRAIAHEIRVFAVALDQDAVLLVAECGGTEPGGAILFVQVTLRIERLERPVDSGFALVVLLVQAALREVPVEVIAEFIQRTTHIVEHGAIAALAEIELAFGGIGIHPLLAVGIEDSLGDIAHIRAAVALLGHLHVLAAQLQIAHHDGIREHVHLHAVVVDVELLVHVVAAELHDARHGIAQRGPSAVADVHGARGIRAHIFQVHLALVAGNIAAAEVGALRAHLAHDILEYGRLQLQVDEARSGDVRALNEVVCRQMIDNRGSDVARCPMSQLRAAQGHGRGPIAIRLVLRTLERRFGHALHRKAAVGDSRLDALLHNLLKLFANLHGSVLLSLFRAPNTSLRTTWRT